MKTGLAEVLYVAVVAAMGIAALWLLIVMMGGA
jgi:hypothetical protein